MSLYKPVLGNVDLELSFKINSSDQAYHISTWIGMGSSFFSDFSAFIWPSFVQSVHFVVLQQQII